MSDEQPFRFHHRVDVRFKDIDLGGHAHHSHALVYFEEARGAWWRQVVGRDGVDDIDYILADASIRWHRRIHWPSRLDVSLRVPLLARKHFALEYRVHGPEGELLVSGSTVQVMYDYGTEASKRIPAEVRTAIERHEGPFGPRGRWIGGGPDRVERESREGPSGGSGGGDPEV